MSAHEFQAKRRGPEPPEVPVWCWRVPTDENQHRPVADVWAPTQERGTMVDMKVDRPLTAREAVGLRNALSKALDQRIIDTDVWEMPSILDNDV